MTIKHEIKITERGWAGHFCAAHDCRFRRNTLIEYGEKRLVVSTVGNLVLSHSKVAELIGGDRYYEIMAFSATWMNSYWEADISKEISFDSEWRIDKVEFDSDKKANEMHEAVVLELSKKIKKM